MRYDLAIIGRGNAVGLEQANSSHVSTLATVVEALERLAPFEEPEASAVIEAGARIAPTARTATADVGPEGHTPVQGTVPRGPHHNSRPGVLWRATV